MNNLGQMHLSTLGSSNMQLPSPKYLKRRAEFNASMFGLVQKIGSASSIEEACTIIADFIAPYRATLLTIKFSDWSNERSTIRPYANYPNSIDAVTDQMDRFGGSPITKESRKRMSPFSYLSVDRNEYSSLLERRFFQEVDKLGFRDIAVLPVIYGRGMVIAVVGLNRVFDEKMQANTSGLIQHVAAAFLANFPQISKLFEGKLLSELETSVLTALCLGTPLDVVCKDHNMGPHALPMIWKAVEVKLEAKNTYQAVYRAIEMGELRLPRF